MGEVYFRVSQQTGWLPSKVIKNKFNPDIKFLIMKHAQNLRQEQEEYKKIQEEMS